MNTEFILQLIAYTIPALVVSALSYIYFNAILKRQSQRDKFIIDNLKGQQKIDTTALRLQALERLTLFIERIDLQKLLLRIPLNTEDSQLYSLGLIQNITQEYEYNLSQQVYISEELWELINKHKNSILTAVQNTTNRPGVINATQLQKQLIEESSILTQSTAFCLSAIKSEAKQYL
ncbi:DUF7935 family protein [Myroides pelagicus]|uniref:Uncharacterized protein n=1 Tax=Myroides pelagicus TaxID=270914 RepID=A0A7K1GJW9_9FLAO|nr:hypothetical protein [Myroides pelagicus]MEC4113927.1 hypothetical protein [Myroides pelagicus]MTH29161.1 hypothetical protein [Myroides pelagicus]